MPYYNDKYFIKNNSKYNKLKKKIKLCTLNNNNNNNNKKTPLFFFI